MGGAAFTLGVALFASIGTFLYVSIDQPVENRRPTLTERRASILVSLAMTADICRNLLINFTNCSQAS